MKIKFQPICSCFQLMGYKGMKDWWELKKTLEKKMKLSYALGRMNEAFNAEKAFEIVVQDGERRMIDCEKCKKEISFIDV